MKLPSKIKKLLTRPTASSPGHHDADVIRPSSKHTRVVSDYQTVEFFRAKAQKLGITAGTSGTGKIIHVFRVICADSRGRSQRLVNASHVLHEINREAGNEVYTHTLEVAGSTLFPDEVDRIKRKMLQILTDAKDKSKVEFRIEAIGHSAIVNRDSPTEWKTDPNCGYHCGFTHGDSVAKELQEEIQKMGHLRGETTTARLDLKRFMGKQYGFYGTIYEDGGQGYIYGIPDPKKHMEVQYNQIVRQFSDFIKDGILPRQNIATYVHDFRDHYLRLVKGGKGGWSEKVHRIAQLEENETPYSKRTEAQKPTILAIAHPDVEHRSTVPLMALENLGPELAPGKVFVNAVYSLEDGKIGPSTHAAVYYYARHLGGKVVHVRGRDEDETERMYKAVVNDPILGFIIDKYGLTVRKNDHGKEKDIIKRLRNPKA